MNQEAKTAFSKPSSIDKDSDTNKNNFTDINEN